MVFTYFHSWGGAPNLPFFFSLQKKKAKRLAPWEPIKPILSRAFYNLSFLGLHPKPALLFSLQKRPCGRPLQKASTPRLLLLGRRPKPALLFLIAEKEGKKASTPGSHKIYFYPGILQLPTVGQVKCLYTPLKINFIDGFKGVRLTATAKARR